VWSSSPDAASKPRSDPQATGNLFGPLMSWVEQGQAPGAVTLQTVNPNPTQPSGFTVLPFDPNAAVNGHGLNSGYNWIGRFH
jgi:hypothetical protein